ncbi:MAG: translation initiation factor IF-2 [Candidatus Eisenbacteria bacterium]|nr:translation initiation factor IF-2 [Candidatus Eisenbacteria bacterium]
MAKKRIYQVAKDFHVSSEAMLKVLREMRVDAKSHMSSIDEDLIEEIRKRFAAEKAAVREKEVRKRELMEHRAKEETPASKTSVRPLKPVEKDAARKGRRRRVVDEKAVRDSVRKTLAGLDIGRRRRRRRRPEEEEEKREGGVAPLRVSEFLSVGELAGLLGVTPSEVIAKCMELGLLVTINRRLDRDTIETVAVEFGRDVEFVSEFEGEPVEEGEAKRVSRHPVVTIMGHVDHGKTSLLDYIRKSNVIAGEVGGITQHIGAYEVETPGGRITFLDTPGHEAFSAMRARGAQVTDLVVLVVAADEPLMPQALEAIDHARAAGVAILVAVNKIDLPGADPMRIKQQLADRGLQSDEWGGKTVTVEVSAKTGVGVDRLLEMILLVAEMMEMTSDPSRKARGTVVETRLEPGRGVVVTMLVQQGTLRVGDPFVAGIHYGKVRALFDERGRPRTEGGPSSPVEVLGCSGAPQAGDTFQVVADEREAREISTRRKQQAREHVLRAQKRVRLEDVYAQIQAGEIPRLSLVLKGDVDGSVEALSDSLQKLSTDEVQVEVIHRGVGPITESDVLLAAASNAIVIGFHVKADVRAAALANEEGVNILFYQIIYEAVSDVQHAMEGLLRPELRQKTIGQVEVREVFKIGRVGVVAGSYVQSGTVVRNARVRVLREGNAIYEGRIASLRRFKEDVREVQAGFECGIVLDAFQDIQKTDILEIFQVEEIARKL